MQEMIRKDLTEGLVAYEKDLSKEIVQKKSLLDGDCCALELGVLKSLDKSSAEMGKALSKLFVDTKKAEGMTEALETASYYESTVLADMDELRKYADEAEALIPEKYLSYPTYGEMLFSLR